MSNNFSSNAMGFFLNAAKSVVQQQAEEPKVEKPLVQKAVEELYPLASQGLVDASLLNDFTEGVQLVKEEERQVANRLQETKLEETKAKALDLLGAALEKSGAELEAANLQLESTRKKVETRHSHVRALLEARKKSPVTTQVETPKVVGAPIAPPQALEEVPMPEGMDDVII